MDRRPVHRFTRPLPGHVYDRMKWQTRQHIWLHYLLHHTYCATKSALERRDDYCRYSPAEWVTQEKGREVV